VSFRDCDIRDWRGNPWSAIGDEWMLITAGGMDSWNTMTASWGGFGHLWNMDVVFAFVRPTRHTQDFIERSGRFAVSFLGAERREALRICGSVSGRDADKAVLAGLTPIPFGDNRQAGFAESSMEIACRVLYCQDIDPESFRDRSLLSHYPKRDYHRMYVGAIERARIAER
jgi:flavin reductase (DIM6/NTAB) family NADH-FMN oxidoreductase RutF